MKKVIITIAVFATIGGAGYFIYTHKAPHFSIEQVDYVSKSGYYLFGKQKVSFGPSSPVTSPMVKDGYTISTELRNVTVGAAMASVLVFRLFKKGKFVKEVGMIDFTNKKASGMFF